MALTDATVTHPNVPPPHKPTGWGLSNGTKVVDAGWRAPRPSLKVGQDYGYQQRSPIYLLVAKRAGIDTLMCASMKLARELKGGCSATATAASIACSGAAELKPSCPSVFKCVRRR